MSKEQNKEDSTRHVIDFAEILSDVEELRAKMDTSWQKVAIRLMRDGMDKTRARIAAFDDDAPSAPPLPPAANGGQPAPPVRERR
jgi:hypothetical protein